MIFFVGFVLVSPFGNQGPSFVREPPGKVDFSNSTGVRIDCLAQGSPMPVVNWLSGDNKPIVSIPGTREIFSNGSLYFLPFQPSNFRPDVHTAGYKCTATNNVGKIVSREVRIRAGQSHIIFVRNAKKICFGCECA
jgi:Immunoglobulin I-set domain